MTLGNRISRLRKEQKLSQEFIAESLNVSRQAVSKWENDLSSPDTENLIGLARLLEVDVEYLATGQLTEEMESEPIPEPPAPPKVEKPKGEHKRLKALLMAALLLGNIVFFCLWQYEKNNEVLMEDFCTSAAYAAKERFADFAHYGSDTNYWQGVAEFRRFMQAYHLLMEDRQGNYLECNELYSNLLFEKERVVLYVEELRRVCRMLSEDFNDINAFHEMDKLNNLIAYGE